jgi:chromosomal replication initiator protein
MIVDVNAPDHESRVAILKTKAAQNNFMLSDELAQIIASEVEGNVRDLEGVLNRVICQTQLKGASLDAGDVRQIVKNNLRPQRSVSVKDLVERVARYYDIDDVVIYEKTRKKEVVKPRQIIMYLMREDFGVSFPSIGQKLGGRDHTTVIHSCEKIRTDLVGNPSLRREIEEIRAIISLLEEGGMTADLIQEAGFASIEDAKNAYQRANELYTERAKDSDSVSPTNTCQKSYA